MHPFMPRGPSAAVLLALTFVAATAGAAPAGDVERGRDQYEARCTGCHSVDENRVGPAHRGVFGRRAGQAPGFAYSAAVRESGVVWTEATLDRWLADPQAFIPGQAMYFHVDDPRDRRDLIAYLATLAP